jgi:hypothetical protein
MAWNRLDDGVIEPRGSLQPALLVQGDRLEERRMGLPRLRTEGQSRAGHHSSPSSLLSSPVVPTALGRRTAGTPGK